MATPSENNKFDADHFPHLRFGVLLLEEGCWRLSGSSEVMKIIPMEISGIKKSFKKTGRHRMFMEFRLSIGRKFLVFYLRLLWISYNLSSPVGMSPDHAGRHLYTGAKEEQNLKLLTNYRETTVLSVFVKLMEYVF